MKAVMGLSQITFLSLAFYMCISGLSIDEAIEAAYKAAGRQYTFVHDNNTVVAELDMIMKKEDWDRIYGRHRGKRMADRNNDKRWANKTLFYLISNIFNGEEKEIITGAMEVWASHTCLQFRKRQKQRNYIAFTNGDGGCSSSVGMEGGKQKINLGTGCVKKPIVIHEIGHAIGLYHTHSRPDRDDYVTINMSNVERAMQHNFMKASFDEVTVFGIDYDYRSNMHYGKRYFSKNLEQTIIPKDHSFLDIIGKSIGPSFRDIKMVNTMYECHAHCPTTTCPCNGFLNKDCECMCPGDPTTGSPANKCIDVTEISCILGAMQENMKRLQMESVKQQNSIKGLREDLLIAKQDLQKAKQDTKELKQQLESKQNQLESQQSQFHIKISKFASLQAFHIYMDKGAIYPNPGDVIPFNRVLTNIGGGFNATTHKFRCPVTGVYAFWFSLNTGMIKFNINAWSSGSLVLDSTRLSHTYCFNAGDRYVRMMCSNHAITECQAGSEVWVEGGWPGVKLYGDSDPVTTFSGFLLKAS